VDPLKTVFAESMSAGMMMLTSSVIALPIKILFFILIDE
jgi:flagellar biosynthesis protein FliP